MFGQIGFLVLDLLQLALHLRGDLRVELDGAEKSHQIFQSAQKL
jgi:hypothetical protein